MIADNIYVCRPPPTSALRQYFEPEPRLQLRRDDHDRGTRMRAAAMVTVCHGRIEIDRVARLEHGLFIAHRQYQPPAQHVNEFEPVMLVRKRLALRPRRKVGEVGAE